MKIYANYLPLNATSALVLVAALLPATTFAADWKTPRTSFGDPDLQGVWTNATMTPFERPKNLGDQSILTPEVAAKMEENNPFERMREMDSKPTDPNAPAPSAGGGVGGYNVFWMDPGTKIVKIDGNYHTSIITTKDGQVPYTEAGQKAFVDGYAVRRSDVGFDGPEVRALGERCLVGFGSTGGPPMLSVLYNNHYQITQSPGYVMIMAEMNHDARIIRLNGKHGPDNIKPWLGDSVGHWDGDTLVVETVNTNPDQSIRSATRHRLYIPSTAKITERFKRVSDDVIEYTFKVEDDKAYKYPWEGALTLNSTDENIFEYACHEGNYSLPGILAGAREAERNGEKPNED